MQSIILLQYMQRNIDCTCRRVVKCERLWTAAMAAAATAAVVAVLVAAAAAAGQETSRTLHAVGARGRERGGGGRRRRRGGGEVEVQSHCNRIEVRTGCAPTSSLILRARVLNT